MHHRQTKSTRRLGRWQCPRVVVMFFLEPDPVGSWVGGALASRWSCACYKLTKRPVVVAATVCNRNRNGTREEPCTGQRGGQWYGLDSWMERVPREANGSSSSSSDGRNGGAVA